MRWRLRRPLEKGGCEICAFRPGGTCKHELARMSCVTRVMTRDVGVVSSHLQSKELISRGQCWDIWRCTSGLCPGLTRSVSDGSTLRPLERQIHIHLTPSCCWSSP